MLSELGIPRPSGRGAVKSASANGGLRKRGVSGQLKAMGVKSGFPDIQIPVARGGYLGLFIELKKLRGRASGNQKWWQKELKSQGYRALVIEGWRASWAAIEAYYVLPPTLSFAALK